ncbi:MAG: hypothetical protein J5610_05315 [Prevotella sp.]|nr:hypothetical protein [Prevotella sp.]
MNTSIFIIGAVFLIGIALVIYKHKHRMSLHENVDQLRSIIKVIFKEKGEDAISQNRLIKGLKYHLGVNEKMALKLIGKARREGIIELEKLNSEKIGKSTYKLTATEKE